MIWWGTLAALGQPEAASQLSACVAAPVAWPEVVAEARHLRMASLVYAGLQAATVAVPRPAVEELRRTTLAVGARSARLERAAASVIAAASNNGIPVVVLKGFALQHLAYPSGIARPMDDVDLLVAATDAPRLGRLLWTRGYRNDLRGEEDFFSPDRSHSVDLHTDVVNTTRLPARRALWPEPFQAFWRRRQPFALGGITAWALGPQDCIQHLAVHAVHHHGMQGALWLADLLAALTTWPAAARAIQGAPAGVRRSVWYCLEALAARGQDPVPDARAALRPSRLLPGERAALSSTARADRSGLCRYALTLACLPRWTAKISFLRQLAIPRGAVYAAGFSDAGPVPRHAWMAHWGHLARLVMTWRRRRRPERPLLAAQGRPAPAQNAKCPNGKQILDLAQTVLYHPPAGRPNGEVDR